MGITKRDDPVTGNHCNLGVGATATPVNTESRLEDILDVHTQLALAFKLMGKHIEQDFRVGFCIDVTQVILKQFLLEAIGVGQVPVVGQTDSIRGIHIKRLSLG